MEANPQVKASYDNFRHSEPIFPHYVLSDVTQRHSLLQHQSEEMKILNISFPRVEIEPTISRVYSHTLVPLCHDWHRYE